MNYKDLWPALQQDVLGVLLADPFLGTRPGLAIEPGDIDSVIKKKIIAVVGHGGDDRDGVGFLVLPIERADDDNLAGPGGPLKLTVSVQWLENVAINRSATGTGVPIRVYAAWTEKVLKLYTPVGLTQNFVPATPVISEFTDAQDKSLRIGMVEFTALEADFRPFVKINRPQISVAGQFYRRSDNDYQLAGPVTASVSAPDADAIWYTLDNSHPREGNPTATLYTGPVPITKPCLFRTRAFAQKKSGSDTAAVNFFQ